ncbi:hypothetical protein BGZ81_008289 [Podila clonocystis]|nr:hypothetical protein BGZ81_008289 [Podila clonocystis]
MPDLKSDLKSGARSIEIDRHWVTLGPFPTGMREQDFGADPLEAFGGFRSLEYDPEARYPSELARFGSVSWNSTEQDDEGWVHVIYPDVEWQFNQMFMGWSFNQYQAWARSTFQVPDLVPQDKPITSDGLVPVTIQCANVGDFYVDDERLSGDWYDYGLTRHVLRLAPGSTHTLSIRLAHEIRIFGGAILPPPSKFRCVLEAVGTGDDGGEAHVQVVTEGHGGIILMDVVDGVVAGDLISVALRNVGAESVRITEVKVMHGSERFVAQLRDPETMLNISPTVHRPLAIQLALKDQADLAERLEFSLEFSFVIDNNRKASVRTDVLELQQKTWGEIYKYTFTDFDGTVHYAAAFPPSRPEYINTSAPILVALHGAGREVETSPFWLEEYQQRENTWIVLPTGRSPWGYDWHGASIKNVMNALESLALHLPGVPVELRGLAGIRPDPERLFIAGHSNGGQGAWFLTTHYPDKAIAATPAAGYVNIKQYAPYSNWLSNSYTDLYLQGILGSAIAEYDNDVYMSNTVGIPILARVGSADDNVPPFSSRKMVRLGQENSHNRSGIRLSEVAGGGHWFTGILHGAVVQEFLRDHLNDDVESSKSSRDAGLREVGVYPPFPSHFEITTINPGSMGSKGGIKIEQLQIPFRKGSIKVQIEKNHEKASSIWSMHTTNIRRFGFDGLPALVQRRGQISRVVIDDDVFELDKDGISIGGVMLTDGVFVKDHGHNGIRKWTLSTSNQWQETERHRETYGPAIQVLEKKLVIVVGKGFMNYSPEFQRTAQRVARLIAHDVYQYGRSDVEIVTDSEYFTGPYGETDAEKVNLVLVGDEQQNKLTSAVLSQTRSEVTMNRRQSMVSVHPATSAFEIESKDFKEPGTGLLMIRPWGSRNLAMIIAGVDEQGLETAARLFPKRTGLLVPDWVVTGPEMPWKGAGGILAAGFWGNHWEYQPLMSA